MFRLEPQPGALSLSRHTSGSNCKGGGGKQTFNFNMQDLTAALHYLYSIQNNARLLKNDVILEKKSKNTTFKIKNMWLLCDFTTRATVLDVTNTYCSPIVWFKRNIVDFISKYSNL